MLDGPDTLRCRSLVHCAVPPGVEAPCASGGGINVTGLPSGDLLGGRFSVSYLGFVSEKTRWKVWAQAHESHDPQCPGREKSKENMVHVGVDESVFRSDPRGGRVYPVIVFCVVCVNVVCGGAWQVFSRDWCRAPIQGSWVLVAWLMSDLVCLSLASGVFRFRSDSGPCQSDLSGAGYGQRCWVSGVPLGRVRSILLCLSAGISSSSGRPNLLLCRVGWVWDCCAPMQPMKGLRGSRCSRSRCLCCRWRGRVGHAGRRACWEMDWRGSLAPGGICRTMPSRARMSPRARAPARSAGPGRVVGIAMWGM